MDQQKPNGEFAREERKYHDAVDKLYQELDARILRKIELKDCSANNSWSRAQIESCRYKLDRQIKTIHPKSNGEMHELRRLPEGCYRKCSRRVKVGNEISESEQILILNDEYGCFSECIDNHINRTIPAAFVRIYSKLQKFHSKEKTNAI